MTETRRNSRGEVLGPSLYDDRSYDERQIDPVVPRVIEAPSDPVEVFLNRWHWRGPREVVRRELVELIEGSK